MRTLGWKRARGKKKDTSVSRSQAKPFNLKTMGADTRFVIRRDYIIDADERRFD